MWLDLRRGASLGRTVARTAFLAAWLSGPFLAQAQQHERARLLYERGPGAERCPDEVDLRDRVSIRLGYDPFVDEGSSSVTVRVAAVGRNLEAIIELRRGTDEILGERRLTSRDLHCEDLASSIVLAVAIAIDPVRLSEVPAEPPTTPVQAPEPAPPSPPPVVVPISSPPSVVLEPGPVFDPSGGVRIADSGLFGGGGLALTMGSIPGPVLGVSAIFGYRTEWFSLALDGLIHLPAHIEVEGGEVSVTLLYAGLSSCARFGIFSACAIFNAGGLKSSGEESAWTPHAATGGRLATDFRLSPSAYLSIYVDVTAALARTTLTVDDAKVWKTPPLGGNVGLTIGAGP